MRWVSELDVVDEVPVDDHHTVGGHRCAATRADAPRVLLIDTGYKHSIARCLQDVACACSSLHPR